MSWDRNQSVTNMTLITGLNRLVYQRQHWRVRRETVHWQCQRRWPQEKAGASLSCTVALPKCALDEHMLKLQRHGCAKIQQVNWDLEKTHATLNTLHSFHCGPRWPRIACCLADKDWIQCKCNWSLDARAQKSHLRSCNLCTWALWPQNGNEMNQTE